MDWTTRAVIAHSERTAHASILTTDQAVLAHAAICVAVRNHGINGAWVVAHTHPGGRWVATWARTTDDLAALVNGTHQTLHVVSVADAIASYAEQAA